MSPSCLTVSCSYQYIIKRLDFSNLIGEDIISVLFYFHLLRVGLSNSLCISFFVYYLYSFSIFILWSFFLINFYEFIIYQDN